MMLNHHHFAILLFVLLRYKADASACSLCPRGEIAEPDKPLSIPEFAFVDTCGYLDTLVGTMLTEGDPQCEQLQSLSTYCGCPPPEDSCSFCPDGSKVGTPEKELPWLAEEFGGTVLTCELLEAYLESQPTDADICTLGHYMSAACGCPYREDHCVYCNGEPLADEYKNKTLHFTAENGDTLFEGTCEAFSYSQFQLSRDEEYCKVQVFSEHLCGCNDGFIPYCGTSTVEQQKALAWIPRCVAMVSLLGSLCLFYHILSSKKRRSMVYTQMMLFIAFFDIVTSVVYIVGAAAIPAINPRTGEPWGIYGAAGTESTCQASGFFWQLGLASIFLNVSLTVYFLLIIVYGVREERLKKLRPCLLVPPIVLGLALAGAVLPHIRQAYIICQPAAIPVQTHLWVGIVFITAPIVLSTISILSILIIIHCKVRRQFRTRRLPVAVKSDLASEQPSSTSSPDHGRTVSLRLPPKTNSRAAATSAQAHLEREVFWQCVCYALAFAFTWPMGIALVFKGRDFNLHYSFWVMACVMSPMQGLSNALCYFRPYLRQYFANKNSKCCAWNSCAWLHWRRAARFDAADDERSANPSTLGGGQQNTESPPEPALSSFSFFSRGNNVNRVSHFDAVSDPVAELANLGQDSSDETDVAYASNNCQGCASCGEFDPIAINEHPDEGTTSDAEGGEVS